MPSSRALPLWETQVTDSIVYDDNRYTNHTYSKDDH